PLPEVHHPEVVDAAAHPVADDRPVAVRAQVRERAPGDGARTLLVLLGEGTVLPRIGADAVEADAPGVRDGEVREVVVEEAGAVRQPVDLADLVDDLVREPGAGGGLEEIERGILVARLEEAESDELAVEAGLEPGERRQA